MDKDQVLLDLISKVENAIQTEEERAEEGNRAYAGIDDQLSQLRAELEQERERREAIEAELQMQVVGQTMSEIHSFADGLVREGRLPPAQRGQAVTLLSVVANLDGDVKSYALGDETEDADQTPYALVHNLLSNLPTVSTLRQKATASADDGIRRFSGDTTNAQEMHSEIIALQKAEGLSYIQAFEKVRRQALEAQG